MIFQTFSYEEISSHNKINDCWVIIDNKVLDLTRFIKNHPGGTKILLDTAGKDITEPFQKYHRWSLLTKYIPNFQVGIILKSKKKEIHKQVFSSKAFGELIPYGDPTWYQDWHSPYYNNSHHRVRNAMRCFVELEIIPFCHIWDEMKKIPKSLFRKAAEANWLQGMCGAPWLTKYGGEKLVGNIKPEEYDYFHELIIQDEICRAGSGGVIWCLLEGLNIGLPPVVKFGSDYLKQKVVSDCLNGKRVICLALTEPDAGSDVAGFITMGRKTTCGKFYLVNGQKKWITNGTFADYFTTAIRTGKKDSRHLGLSFLLIERSMFGLKRKQIKCTGVWASGTAYITFENVKVPIENLIGQEGKGFQYIVQNFNHERWGFIIQATRFARVCVEESIKFASNRMVFRHRLIDEPVIRYKLGLMISKVEASWGFLENITHQMNYMSSIEKNRYLAGPIALGKVNATQTFKFCADEALQIFGGRGYTRGGHGEKVERLYREVKAYAIPGGSEEIMADLGVRQAIKYLPSNARL